MVVLDKEDYIEKANSLLVQPAYRSIDRDPTNKLKARLIAILRRIKRETGLEDTIYKGMYPMGCTAPKFYGLLRNPQNQYHLRPIVSSRGSGHYRVAKVLAKILKPLVGKSLHHIQSTKDFVDRVSKVTLPPGECLCSYDVTALFTSVPVDPALDIIREILEQGTTLLDITVLLVQNIIKLVEFHLHNSYFSFQNKIYEQVEGVTMGSPASPIVANLYMENFEKKVLSTIPNP